MDLTVTAPGTPDLDLRLTVLPRPELQDLNIAVRPPLHTGLAPFEQRNDGDLDVPEGSVIEFQVGTRNADRLTVRWGDMAKVLDPDVDNRFSFKETAVTDLTYTLLPSSNAVPTSDSVRYRLSVLGGPPAHHPGG